MMPRYIKKLMFPVLFAIQVMPLHADTLDGAVGRALFKRNWIPAPSSTDASDGLGPFFNARSCNSCHRGGGGARIGANRSPAGQHITGAVVRLGDKSGGRDAYYGLQLQTDAVPGLVPEAAVAIRPKLAVTLNGPPLTSGVAMGVRVAPSLFGASDLGLIPDSEILARADPDDRNGDGISGRANITAAGIGRYGWKAAHVTLEAQVAHAFAIDMGLSSPAEPLPYGDCTLAETACRGAATGESALTENREISSETVRLVAAYLDTLKKAAAAPAKGAALFDKSGCSQCHVPSLKTSEGTFVYTFSDLLLHDMGSGLDDGVGEQGLASSEWRTAPLRNTAHAGDSRVYLHNGSASTVEAAVNKHGGEGARSRNAFQRLSAADKKRLVDYVNGQY